MNWKRLLLFVAAAAFLIGGTIFFDINRIRHASDPQPGWTAIAGIELALLVLAPGAYRLMHSAKQAVQIDQTPVLWAILLCCGIALLGVLDHFHVPPPIPARLALAGFGLYWLAAGAYLPLSSPPRSRRRAALVALAIMTAQGATTTAALLRTSTPSDALWMGFVTVLAVIYVTLACIVLRKSDDRQAPRERVMTRARTSSSNQ